MASGVVSMTNGLKGPNHTVSTACATGNHAIGDAYRFIRDDFAQVMVAGATENGALPLVLAGFSRAKSLSTNNEDPTKASRPFDKGRDGFVLSEGCGILILEELEHAKERGAQIYAEIVGYGLSGDGYHMTAPDPNGRGAIRAMRLALRGHDVKDIDYVNAHATSTSIGDVIECRAMTTMLEGNDHFHVSSTKGSTGHLLGAAGAVEAIFSTLAIRDQVCPPTLNLEDPVVDIVGTPFKLNFVGPTPIKKEINYALSNSFGFGGINTSLVFKKYTE
jgi:3-oxoacyl-[acyl-carrier-protein] synthase II